MTDAHGAAKGKAPFWRSKTALLLFVSFILLIAGGVLEWLRFTQAPPLRLAGKHFLIKPYLQFGPNPDGSAAQITWCTIDDGKPQNFQFELARRGVLPPQTSEIPVQESARISLQGVPPFKEYWVTIPSLVTVPAEQQYYIKQNDQVIFQAPLRRLTNGRSKQESLRFDVAGDLASGLPSERMVAREIFRSRPNFVLIPGDIVYSFGRTLEYLDHFFPVYNSDQTSLEGVPALRSIMFIAAPGNHDIEMGARLDTRNLDLFPDGLAYFYLWNQPRNGPKLVPGGPNTSIAHGSQAHVAAFTSAAGERYPSMSNFSFDIGNCHFLCLDANPYVDWQQKDLRDWVEKNLQAATTSGAQWKFVVFHQPPFSSDTHHYNDQQMRVLADVFEQNNVDIVFSGHVHNYQRTYPLSFKGIPEQSGSLRHKDGTVNGAFKLDNEYDGIKDKHPHGVIYIVSGCGGAAMTGEKIAIVPKLWQPFTEKFAVEYSFTQCDVSGNHLTVRQMSATGKEIDHFEIDKSSVP